MIHTDGAPTVSVPFPVDPLCPPNPAIEPEEPAEAFKNAVLAFAADVTGRLAALEADKIHADDERVERAIEEWIREDIQAYAGEIPGAISEALDNSDLDDRINRLENRLDAI